MGAKQSAEPANITRPRTSAETAHRSCTNGIGNSTRRSTVTMGSLGVTHHRPALHFERSAVVANGSGGQSGTRGVRANSLVESQLRLQPRPGLEWLYHLNESDSSPEEHNSSQELPWMFGNRSISHPLPPFFLNPNRDSKCSMCGKLIPAEDKEVHFVMCLTKPRVTYNEDVLSTTSGECAICLEDLEEGEAIARLPCLCIYHKVCIDQWFMKSQTCPEHPPD